MKMKTGCELIFAERRRQVRVEGWTPAHDDDEHPNYELTRAAMSYAAVVATPDESAKRLSESAETDDWPWASEWWKPSDDPVRNLVKAGALIAAEIDRLQRKARWTKKLTSASERFGDDPNPPAR